MRSFYTQKNPGQNPGLGQVKEKTLSKNFNLRLAVKVKKNLKRTPIAVKIFV